MSRLFRHGWTIGQKYGIKLPMAKQVANRARPDDYFTAEEWQQLLSGRDGWRGQIGLAQLLANWAIIFMTAALFIVWPNPFSYMAAILIIGGRQLALAIAMHDSSHFALHKNKWLNDFVGDWFAGIPINSSIVPYRPYHLKHHGHVQKQTDPDLVLAAPFPISRASLRRKLTRDITGQTYYRQNIEPWLKSLTGWNGDKRGGPIKRITRAWRYWLSQGALLTIASLSGYWWAYFALWLVPFATWHMVISRVRNIGEHGLIPESENPLQHARTVMAPFIQRALIAPGNVHFHAEHHLFMFLPNWQLGKMHRLLKKKGFADQMQIETGYFNVLKRASDKSLNHLRSPIPEAFLGDRKAVPPTG